MCRKSRTILAEVRVLHFNVLKIPDNPWLRAVEVRVTSEACEGGNGGLADRIPERLLPFLSIVRTVWAPTADSLDPRDYLSIMLAAMFTTIVHPSGST